ncbi:PREDICTED: eukaryotic translation elongation factor 1 epsilon-1, partial [Eufriesea mexicana]|uniref:eukaryotic translation elongation factor 1 epsilon-1 n=1 Tax=Eufriesea mexicana TaxID=516756 RepID=UPI00083C0D36
MVLCNVKCLERISNYLDISPLPMKINENELVTEGFSTMIQHLVEISKYPDILGTDNEMKALSRQWLEYAVVCVNFADISTIVKRVLQELNSALMCNTYLTGSKKTIADITLYYILYSIMRELTLPEKAQYVNVSRWFDNMQQEEKLRQELDLISFDMLH